MSLYKQDLHQWLEEQLISNLQTRLHTSMTASLDFTRTEIEEYMKSILTNTKYHSEIDLLSPRSDFTISYHLDCSNLCSDFHEDIRFKFSLGFTSIIEHFLSKQTETKFSYANLAILGASAFLWKNIGWKVLGVVGSIYGGFYLYERLMWTKTAQERAFKRQYADYAASKMRLIVDLTSGNASAQVHQHLSRYLGQIVRYIDCEKDELCDEMSETEIKINQIKNVLHHGKKLRKQGEKIDSQFNQFLKQYLRTDSRNE